MSKVDKKSGLHLDRREFIVVAGATAVAYLPLAAGVQAAPAPSVAVPAVGESAPQALLADWTIDDMWGVYPRYAEAIGFGRPRGDGERLAAVDPVDAGFLVA